MIFDHPGPHSQQQAALMVAATAQGYISPMTALASHALNGMANSVVPATSGEYLIALYKPSPYNFLKYFSHFK